VAATNTTNHVKIRGRVFTGAGGAVNFTTNASAGSMDWINAGATGIEPGWFANNMNVEYLAVGVPFQGGYYTPSAGAYDGTNYDYLLGSAPYRSSSINLSSRKAIMVTGNAEFYVTTNFTMSGQSRIIVAPGASLRLYVGGDAVFSGLGVFNQTGRATNCWVYGLPGCSQIKFTGNSEFLGVIYAPNAELALGEDETDEMVFKGAGIAGSVAISGKCQFHYDESLLAWDPAL
jgi:hypothetical protein